MKVEKGRLQIALFENLNHHNTSPCDHTHA